MIAVKKYNIDSIYKELDNILWASNHENGKIRSLEGIRKKVITLKEKLLEQLRNEKEELE